MRKVVWRSGLFAALATLCAQAENWPQWRGPFFNGSTSETGLPSGWNATNGFAWVAPLPGFSGATPVIWEDSVFVASPDSQKNLLLICFDRSTGQVRWQKSVASGNRERGRNNMASCSPATDGKRVFALFGTGDLAAFDFTGKELWHRQLAKEYGCFAINFLYGSSPMLYRDHLYVEVIQSTPPDGLSQSRDGTACPDSYLLCLDPATGRNLYRHIRPTDAVAEGQEAYTTPIPWEGAAGTEILIVGGNYVTAHLAATGEEIWRCAGLNLRGERFWRVVPSPVVAEGMVVACGPKRDPVLGIRDGGKGLVTDTHLAWQLKEFTSDCVTPLAYQGKLYVLDGDHQVMTCLDPKTGQTRWRGNLGVHEIFRSSPTGADGKIYCLSESGTAVVLGAGDDLKILSTVAMGEGPVRASIAVAHGQLFIRTAQHLFCVGKSSS